MMGSKPQRWSRSRARKTARILVAELIENCLSAGGADYELDMGEFYDDFEAELSRIADRYRGSR